MRIYSLLFLFVIVSLPIHLQAQEVRHATEAVLDDAEFLLAQLEAKHPNLYTYSHPENYQQWLEKLKADPRDSVTTTEAFRLIASISPLLRDGHSYIYPGQAQLDAFYSGTPLFPFDVFLREDQLIVLADFSREQLISPGSELLAINGKPIAEIQNLIVNHTCRDGNNIGYPRHLYYQFFTAYYGFYYGFQDSFSIHFRNENGKEETVKIEALPRSEIAAQRASELETGIALQFLEDQKSAVLRIRSFDKKILKDDYGQKFKKEIKQAFKTLQSKGIENLAVDLRDNQGGELSHGIFLLQHFMTADFKCVDNYQMFKDGREKTLKSRWDNYFSPRRAAHFNGKVCVFTNGGSFSCSAIVANTVKEAGRGEILGEMTGGSAYVNSGAPNETLTLPQTGILFTIPKTRYNLRRDLSEIRAGVIPDIEISDTPNRRLSKTDSYLDVFLEDFNAANKLK
ncbi:MAG: hypothetical protein GYB31_01500 [Bacteroidetes bacterium]|nr:hypothetical protein [Bacteroidota bacterium]